MESIAPETQDQSSLGAANMSLAALAASFLLPAGIWPSSWGARVNAQDVAYEIRALPEKAQIIDQKAFNALDEVLPPYEANATTVSLFLLPSSMRHGADV
jgi:hypothetical protein